MTDEPYSDEAARLAPNPHTERLRETECDHCNGTGWVTFTVIEGKQAIPAEHLPCGSCMGKGSIQENKPRPGVVEAEIRRERE